MLLSVDYAAVCGRGVGASTLDEEQTSRALATPLAELAHSARDAFVTVECRRTGVEEEAGLYAALRYGGRLPELRPLPRRGRT